ncbi:MAG: spore coat protein [Desulfosporosinus sp.]|jgi:spore coat protein CotF
MSSIIGSIFARNSNASADKTIANSSASGLAASAQAYFTASLAATTPEVRRLFSEYSTQTAMGHEALTGLMLKKGWIEPYASPSQQLQSSIHESMQTLDK